MNLLKQLKLKVANENYSYFLKELLETDYKWSKQIKNTYGKYEMFNFNKFWGFQPATELLVCSFIKNSSFTGIVLVFLVLLI